MKTITQKIILAAAIFFPLLTHAQPPVLLNADYYMPGASAQYRNIDPLSVGPIAQGPNSTWNFSSLSFTDTLTQNTILPSQTSYAATYPGANVCERNSDGTKIFQRMTADSSIMVGLVDSVNGMVMTYSDPYVSITRPFAYGDFMTDNMRHAYTISAQNYSGSGWSTTDADSYGTLTLPSGTYTNVCRVKFSQYFTDTSLSFGIIMTVKVVSIAWFQANSHAAIFRYDSTIVNSSVYNDTTVTARTLLFENATGIASHDEMLHAYLYEQNGVLSVNGNFENGKNYTAELFDINGKLLAQNSFTGKTEGSQTGFSLRNISPGEMLIVRIISSAPGHDIIIIKTISN
ncbi:MAG: hypothetical protein HY064_08920 [Bacteroidetes bacterium]|nr:hypothetical protein [Bacteroidota bacterium]